MWASRGAAASRERGLAACGGGGFPAGWQVWALSFSRISFLLPTPIWASEAAWGLFSERRQAKVSVATLALRFVCMVRGLTMLVVLMSSWRSCGNLWVVLQAFAWGVDWLWLELHSFFPLYKWPPWKINPRTYVRGVFCMHWIVTPVWCVELCVYRE